MSPHITVQYACRESDAPDAALLEQWAAAALEGQGERGELVIRIVDEQESAELNGRWRGRHQPTNVLSFPASPMPGPAPAPLGDVMLCAPVMARQARQWGVAPLAHWAHMAIHGILHLLGHDHEEAQDARRMEALEDSILRRLQLPCAHNSAQERPADLGTFADEPAPSGHNEANTTPLKDCASEPATGTHNAASAQDRRR